MHNASLSRPPEIAIQLQTQIVNTEQTKAETWSVSSRPNTNRKLIRTMSTSVKVKKQIHLQFRNNFTRVTYHGNSRTLAHKQNKNACSWNSRNVAIASAEPERGAQQSPRPGRRQLPRNVPDSLPESGFVFVCYFIKRKARGHAKEFSTCVK